MDMSIGETVKLAFNRLFVDGYTKMERWFMAIVVAMQIAVYIIAPDSPLNIIAGIAGCIGVIMCAKGRIESYFISAIQVITYFFLALQNKFYLECAENLFYIVTTFWGIVTWKNNLQKSEDNTKSVVTKKFNAKQWILAIAGTIVATVVMGYVGTKIGSAQAYTDAATNVMAIFAQILMVRRYREQWIWWIVIDLLNIKMWGVVGNWSMVAMYIAWTVNCIYGWLNWTKLNKTK